MSEITKTSSTHIEFVSPLKIDEAVKRLDLFFNPRVPFSSPEKLEFSRVNPDYCTFHIVQRRGAEVRGHLTHLDGTSTVVTCDASVTENEIITKFQILGMILLSVIAVLVGETSAKILGLIGMPVIIFLVYHQHKHIPQNMLQKINQELSDR